MNNLTEERLLDLLCKKATTGLSVEEAAQISELERAFPEWAGDDSFEMAAAAISLTFADRNEKMPVHLREKIMADADTIFETVTAKSPVDIFQPTADSRVPRQVVQEEKVPFWQWLGWGVAAFATILLAVNIYVTRFQTDNGQRAEGPPISASPLPLTSAEKREQMLASAENIIRAEVAEADPKKQGKITGDVVWNEKDQKGYIRFRGLPVNDPSKEQYQVWIFDEAQDEKFPVDGGVFDIGEDGEVIITIDAKINIKNPKLFAVTKEKPGGVVVSDRKGIVAVAKV